MLQNANLLASLPNFCLGTFATLRSPELGIRVHGSGVGHKVGQLLISASNITAAGFYLNPKQVLGASLIDAALRQHGLSMASEINEESAREIFSQSRIVMRLAEQMRDGIAAPFLAVRSSAYGDARGTGIYRSMYCTNTPENVLASVVEVLSSYFSEDGIHFRRRADKAPGFAVSVEKLLGRQISLNTQRYREDFYAPILSGFAYTDSVDGPKIIAAKGFADIAVEDATETVTLRPDFPKHSGEASTCFRIEELFYKREKLHGDNIIETRGISRDGSIDAAYPLDRDGVDKIDFAGFFKGLEKLQKLEQQPLYIEWVATWDGTNKPQIFVTQIATLKNESDYFELPEHSSNVVASCRLVRNSCNRVVNKTLIYSKLCDCEEIENFNLTHTEGYLFILESRLLSKAVSSSMRIKFRHYSNATAILVIGNGDHNDDIFSHFDGSCLESGIVIGIIEPHSKLLSPLKKCGLSTKQINEGLSYIDAPLRIVASGSRKNRGKGARSGLLVLQEKGE